MAKNCIIYGHCVAICPREAIDNKRILLSNQISTKDFQKLSSEETKNFLTQDVQLDLIKKHLSQVKN
ncbi:hypothetical protein JTT07_01895 [Clostridium botulinum]|nr:hypothetical protein [Clostridium botulinum]MCS4477054.1 hypothetical protein [Clostridium botulinum]MCS4515650.1 hypothetical protein [Clostridium botulinum]MCS4523352.1 hypothetical protein [Clostridium botulinum]MCS4525750.1 hypothetical protein [Clostridium botulinum]